uniref:Uncharacterized protein n=1 Tax=Eutreptiella gymnastica TaxID=73025 RepID=A0A7S4LLR3_9EUGL|mmetsp:Transcript_86873/g.144588  ORF Transcript_86873/g.144588 Transcript_86873/m.144588 type:complete len:118 (-) Transcript_86873:364-717(-)|eukprot:CAMPEP_0174286096 /NCGR_PEP_ID=MMETSP0809-20121228/10620_1 /TAXON_ID=73025 ORGANISM="Eutreptiella gymnastica-like, Strain CCMP1594" /NCGR_SAMPLE_ID=MMETSP0809 /ASSEMBLY_ACC=CAM_ASM_000658 /LENGTH=117 /DNA_ID=CAMNT_0015382033 /DNA_START=55 /DNA_END=408 /DNA_ORIENTATION=+
MAIPHNLIVTVTFNPPEVFIIGPIKETTIQKLQSILPEVCTNLPGQKTAIQFSKIEQPPHWHSKLIQSYCDDVGQTKIILTILDCLEQEGNWKMKGSNAFNHDEVLVTYKFFFVQKM